MPQLFDRIWVVPALALVLVGTSPGEAAEQPAQSSVAVIGEPRAILSTERAIELPLEFDAVVAVQAARTLRVSRAGVQLSPGAFAVRLDSKKGSLQIEPDEHLTAAAGEYTVIVELTRAESDPVRLTLTFIRPAAVLDLHQPLKVQRVVLLPYMSWIVDRRLILGERTGNASIVLAPPVKRAGSEGIDSAIRSGRAAELRDVGGDLRGRLRLVQPDRIAPHGQENGEVTVEGSLPLGTVTGTLDLWAPQFASNPLSVPVQVTSRVWLGWLAIALAVSIFLGYWVRTVLESRLARRAKRISAERIRAQLVQLRAEATDAEHKAKIEEIERAFATVLNRAGTEPDEIETATEKARTELESELERLKAAQTEAATKLAELRRALHPVEGQSPEIAAVLSEELARLDGMGQRLEDGDVASVHSELERHARKLLDRVRRAVADRCNVLSDALSRTGLWPESTFDRYRAGAESAVAKVQERLENGEKKVGELIEQSAELEHQVHQLADRGTKELMSYAWEVVRSLREAGSDIEEIDRVQNRIEVLKDHPLSMFEIFGLADKVRDLREAVILAIEAVKPVGDADEIKALRDGHFLAAVDEVRLHRQKAATPARVLHERLSKSFAVEHRRSDDLGGAEKGPTSREPSAGGWAVSLAAPGFAYAGESVVVRLVVTGASDRDEPTLGVEWQLPGDAERRSESPTEIRFIPRSEGTVIVRATVHRVAAVDGLARELEARVPVLAARGALAVPSLEAQQQKDQRLLSIVAGLLIGAAGYSIFHDSWIGTFNDVLAVTLWGFSVDLGVHKVRDLAAPILQRSVPLPKVPV